MSLSSVACANSRAACAETGDGTLDLAVANQIDGTVQILVGTGSGTFTPGNVYAAGTFPRALAIADLATYDNKPAAVVVTTQGARRVAYVVGLGCSATNAELVTALSLS